MLTMNRTWQFGYCFEWAIAYQEIHGGDLFMIRGYFPDEDGPAGAELYQDAHCVLSPDGGKTVRDAFGVRPADALIRQCLFSEPVTRVAVVPVSRKEIEEAHYIESEAIEMATAEILLALSARTE